MHYLYYGTVPTITSSFHWILSVAGIKTHRLARKAVRPDCDGTCRCRWQRRLSSRTPFLQSSAVLHRLFEDKGQSSVSSTCSSSSSFSPARSLRIQINVVVIDDSEEKTSKSCFEKRHDFTNDWLSTIKQRGVPRDHTGVLSDAEDSGSLGRIGNIWGENMAHVIRKKTYNMFTGDKLIGQQI